MKRITVFVNGEFCTFDFDHQVEADVIKWVEGLMRGDQSIFISKSHSGQQRIVLKAEKVDGYYIRSVPPETPSPAKKAMEILEKIAAEESKGADWKNP